MTPDVKSLTPRTDAEAKWQHEFNGVIPHFVSADFARQLERENARLREALERWERRKRWIYENAGDNVALRFSLDSSDEDFDAAISAERALTEPGA